MKEKFPHTRMRRNRSSAWVRNMLAETRLHPSDFIWPCFVQEGENSQTAVDSLPGVFRYSIDLLIEEVKQAAALGIPAIALFPVVDASKKCELAKEAYNKSNLICRAVKEIKKHVPNIGIMCDVALDPYTSHGHDGIVINDDVANDETVSVLVKQALTLAKAGADYVAPSDMMDGRIGTIRSALDKKGFSHTGIISYAAKYASAFYGPFRDAVQSKSNLGSKGKHSYQMDFRNHREALREVALDVQEGADMVMVKPGMPYLDIITRVSQQCNTPLLAYHVSGEYAMLKAAAEKGWLDEKPCLLEAMTSFKRAGCHAVLTYGARDIAKWLLEEC